MDPHKGNLPTDDKLLEEDIKWLATEIGLW
jgi:hypothetical protein